MLETKDRTSAKRPCTGKNARKTETEQGKKRTDPGESAAKALGTVSREDGETAVKSTATFDLH